MIAVGLNVDPTSTKGDKLSGQVLGHPNKLPPVVNTIKISYYLLTTLLGVKEGAAVQRGVRTL